MTTSMWKRCVLCVAAVGSLLACSVSDAGFYRMNRRCVRSSYGYAVPAYGYQQPVMQQTAPVQPAPAVPSATAAPAYQSYSYEPGPVAPTPVYQGAPAYQGVPADPNSHARSYYRGDYRVQPGDPVPNMFRADRKLLGLQSN